MHRLSVQVPTSWSLGTNSSSPTPLFLPSPQLTRSRSLRIRPGRKSTAVRAVIISDLPRVYTPAAPSIASACAAFKVGTGELAASFLSPVTRYVTPQRMATATMRSSSRSWCKLWMERLMATSTWPMDATVAIRVMLCRHPQANSSAAAEIAGVTSLPLARASRLTELAHWQ